MKSSAPLTKVQYGLYVECVAHQGEACYNLPYLYVLDGSLEEERLKNAIETAVAAHPTLFTRIELDKEGPRATERSSARPDGPFWPRSRCARSRTSF